VELPVNIMFELNKFYKVDHRLQLSDEVLVIACFYCPVCLGLCTVNFLHCKLFLYVAFIVIFAIHNLVELYDLQADF